MSRWIYAYGTRIGQLRHGETSDIEVYRADGGYLGRVIIEAGDTDKRDLILNILHHWNPAR